MNLYQGILTLLLLANIILPPKVDAFQSNTIDELTIKSGLKPEELGIEKMIADIQFVQLENTLDSYIGNLHGSISMSEDYIFLTDRKLAYLFTDQGDFIKQIGRFGKGPGEYLVSDIVAISPNQDKLLVYDARGLKIIIYDINGGLLSEKSVQKEGWGYLISDIAFINNDEIALAMSPLPTQIYHRIIFLDTNLNTLQKAMPSRIQAYKRTNIQLLNINHGHLYWEENSDTIYFINEAKKILPKIIIKNETKGKKKLRIKGLAYIPGELLIYTLNQNGEQEIFSYNLSKKNTRKILTEKTNFWLDKNRNIEMLYQRLYGYYYIGINKIRPIQGRFVSMFYPAIMLENIDISSMKSQNVIFPKRRNELCRLIQESSLEDNPILIISKYKSNKHIR